MPIANANGNLYVHTVYATSTGAMQTARQVKSSRAEEKTILYSLQKVEHACPRIS